ncbi:hypothetical protein HDC92_004542 [Pedobacter sp. AK017]|uniref:hypothetical protein n=1 Tax=Pedobacter sp. AK017 TaxID=2723073 RepID=UPI001615EE61|nr:hypothetical protein [Pedobacter sp. AK017]MBB5440838.1 hypothetical protein [Pedobacter sp. AK017]
MAKLLGSLLRVARVAIISGGAWTQFEKQVLSQLAADANLSNLSILPTCGTKYYQYNSDWQQLYAENFITGEKNKIITNLNAAVKSAGFATNKIWAGKRKGLLKP